MKDLNHWHKCTFYVHVAH